MSNVLAIDNETEARTAYQQNLGRKLVVVRTLRGIVVCLSCRAESSFGVFGGFD